MTTSTHGCAGTQTRTVKVDRVVAALSGGVDSSVAAALLVESGREVIGVTLNLAGGASRCCSLADADDARQVADQLGIRFYVANYADRFNSGAANKRLGLIAEVIGLAGLARSRFAHKSAGNVQLDPKNPGDKLVTRWGVWVPRHWDRWAHE